MDTQSQSKTIKFNFNLKPSSKKDRSATEDDNAAVVTQKKRVVKTRQLQQLRTTYGSTQRQSCKVKDNSGLVPSMSLLSPIVMGRNDVNNSVQTILLPHSTPNQSSSKLTFRKFHPAHLEQSANLNDDYDLSSATPRTQTMVIPRNQITRQSDTDLSCSQRASFKTLDAT